MCQPFVELTDLATVPPRLIFVVYPCAAQHTEPDLTFRILGIRKQFPTVELETGALRRYDRNHCSSDIRGARTLSWTRNLYVAESDAIKQTHCTRNSSRVLGTILDVHDHSGGHRSLVTGGWVLRLIYGVCLGYWRKFSPCHAVW